MTFWRQAIAGTFLAAVLLVSAPFSAFADVYVKGYYRKDGTYVSGHYRSNPDGNPYNNWSFPGNTNPHTGETATGDPNTYLENYYDNSGSSSSYLPTPTYTTPSTSLTPIVATADSASKEEQIAKLQKLVQVLLQIIVLLQAQQTTPAVQ